MIRADGPAARQYGRLAAPAVLTDLTTESVFCLPIGSHEQHGPHLPLNTDTVIAERFTGRLVQRYGEQHDLWALPAIPYGLSLEHAWSPGTVSLRIASFISLLDVVVTEYLRATPARRLLIINGHGGNRGILEPALHELRSAHTFSVCVIHPASLSTVQVGGETVPEIHAGIRETAMMLELAPEDVHLDSLPTDFTVNGAEAKRLVLDRGTTWPWTSGDTTIATCGVIGGDPRRATVDAGRAILGSALDAAGHVLTHLTNHSP
ncbi:creatininase family protein [Kitasatospora sp. NPDC096128]|uniref:creatininase family protein n=1 Tax=Kitasatospora sp. NPDC096128 TaxID=3155547 RepID=UPI00331CAC92